MKYTICLILCTLLYSCSPRIEDNLRALFTTQVVDSNGDPLPGVRVTVNNNTNIYYQNYTTIDDPDFTLAQGITDSHGSVSMVMLVSKGAFGAVLQADGYTDRYYTIDSRLYDQSLDYNIGQQILKSPSQVTLNVTNNTSVNGINITLDTNYCTQFDQFDQSSSIEFNCSRQLSYSINQLPTTVIELPTFYPSTLYVEYLDQNGMTVTEQFMITNPVHSYDLSI